MPLTIDYSYMLAPPVSGGVGEAELNSAQTLFDPARARFEARRAAGELGFLELPSRGDLLRECEVAAAHARGKFDDVVILGIGGSALGTTALRTALLPAHWNILDSNARAGLPRLHVLDNADPRNVGGLLNNIALPRALFLVISKSGGTAETMAQYLIVRAMLEQSRLAASDHLLFLTDPEKGALRSIAASEGIKTLPVPSNVGGRYSVLSPVGLLPALLTGMDAASLLRGALEMSERCLSASLVQNPAAMYAVLQYLAHTTSGKHIHVFMPYSDALRDFAAWFVQLWAESLGKIVASTGAHLGPTPVPAQGATDQHSQVQLFMEGPADKTITFVSIADRPDDLPIPQSQRDLPAEISYLASGQHTLGELLDAERMATAGALAARGRPNMTIELTRLDSYHVGSLIMLLEIATVMAGELYGINPLDQPGVELGKNFTNALMGKPGSEKAMQEWNARPRPDPARVVRS